MDVAETMSEVGCHHPAGVFWARSTYLDRVAGWNAGSWRYRNLGGRALSDAMACSAYAHIGAATGANWQDVAESASKGRLATLTSTRVCGTWMRFAFGILELR